MTISSYVQHEIDREFRIAIAHGAASTDEVRLARALFDVNAVDPSPANVALVLGAAARLYLIPSQVRRLYGNGHQVYDLVNEAVAAAR